LCAERKNSQVKMDVIWLFILETETVLGHSRVGVHRFKLCNGVAKDKASPSMLYKSCNDVNCAYASDVSVHSMTVKPNYVVLRSPFIT